MDNDPMTSSPAKPTKMTDTTRKRMLMTPESDEYERPNSPSQNRGFDEDPSPEGPPNDESDEDDLADLMSKRASICESIHSNKDFDIDSLNLEDRIFPNHPGTKIKFYQNKEINSMKVIDLQAACKECGVRTTGRKIEMQCRLRAVKEHASDLARRLVLIEGPDSLPAACT